MMECGLWKVEIRVIRITVDSRWAVKSPSSKSAPPPSAMFTGERPQPGANEQSKDTFARFLCDSSVDVVGFSRVGIDMTNGRARLVVGDGGKVDPDNLASAIAAAAKRAS